MFKNEHKKKNKGFTLIEMLVAVLILGILVAIGVPTYLRAVEKSRTFAPINTLKSIAKAEQVEKLKKGLYTNQAQELDLELRDYPDGNIVSGDAFEGKFFDYKIYGEDKSAATAVRKNVDEDKKYTLSIDYKTGEIFCSPAVNKTCIDLGLAEGDVGGNNSGISEEEMSTILSYCQNSGALDGDGMTCDALVTNCSTNNLSAEDCLDTIYEEGYGDIYFYCMASSLGDYFCDPTLANCRANNIYGTDCLSLVFDEECRRGWC